MSQFLSVAAPTYSLKTIKTEKVNLHSIGPLMSFERIELILKKKHEKRYLMTVTGPVVAFNL